MQFIMKIKVLFFIFMCLSFFTYGGRLILSLNFQNLYLLKYLKKNNKILFKTWWISFFNIIENNINIIACYPIFPTLTTQLFGKEIGPKVYGIIY